MKNLNKSESAIIKKINNSVDGVIVIGDLSGKRERSAVSSLIEKGIIVRAKNEYFANMYAVEMA